MRKTSVLLGISVLLAIVGAGLYLAERHAVEPLPNPESDREVSSGNAAATSAETETGPPDTESTVDEADPALVQTCVDNILADLARRLDKTEQLKEDASEAVVAVANAEYHANMHAAKMVLIESDDPEHLHVAALLEFWIEKDPSESLVLIASATDSAPANEILAWDALGICMTIDRESGCRSGELEARLMELDDQNSEALIMIALNRHRRGDEQGALAAMEMAAVAPKSTGYSPEHVLMTERALAASSNLAFAERGPYAIGIASFGLPYAQDFVQMCKEQSWASNDWAYACLGYGETSERQARGLMTQQIARAIHKEALMALGDDERAAAADARSQEIQRSLLSNDPIKPLSSILVMTNQKFFANHFTAVSQHGELQAMAMTDAAARQWFEQSKESECRVQVAPE